MKKYFEEHELRKNVQRFCCVLLIILCALAIAFLTLFVTTPAPSKNNFSVAAIVLTIICCVHYLLQLVFAAITYRKTHPKFSHDKTFVSVSVLALPVATAIYTIIMLFIS